MPPGIREFGEARVTEKVERSPATGVRQFEESLVMQRIRRIAKHRLDVLRTEQGGNAVSITIK